MASIRAPWLTAGDDERLRDALQPLALLLGLGDALLALGHSEPVGRSSCPPRWGH